MIGFAKSALMSWQKKDECKRNVNNVGNSKGKIELKSSDNRYYKAKVRLRDQLVKGRLSKTFSHCLNRGAISMI